MTIRKSRKSLDDSLASEFVYGTPQPKNEPIEEIPPVEVEPAKKLKPTSKSKPQKKGSVMSQLLESATEREATIRLTVDMPQSLHTKLSMLCARTGRKKADVVRLLLNEALQDEALQDLDE